jgi:hypothetical protein
MPVVARAASRCLSSRSRITTGSQRGSPRLKEREQVSFLPNLTGYFWQCAAREHKRLQSWFLRQSVSFSNTLQSTMARSWDRFLSPCWRTFNPCLMDTVGGTSSNAAHNRLSPVELIHETASWEPERQSWARCRQHIIRQCRARGHMGTVAKMLRI